jgi:hypothetical protein
LFAVAGVVILIFYIAIRQEKSAHRVDSPYFRRDTLILDDEYGAVYAKSLERTSQGYVYEIETELEGKQRKVYNDGDLIDLNKSLNVVSNQTYICASIIRQLSKREDLISISEAFAREKRKVANLQAELNDLRYNFNRKVQQSIDNQIMLSRANRPSFKRGGAT